jgi:hypothetical protein
LKREAHPSPRVLRKNRILKELQGRVGKECDSMGVRGESENGKIWLERPILPHPPGVFGKEFAASRK